MSLPALAVVSPSGRSLVQAVRQGLAARADPARAAGMQAYMKSAMPYRGVQSAGLREVCRSVFAEHVLAGFEEWRDTALELWRRAEYREERYAAIELVGARPYQELRTFEALPVHEEMIVTGAWWDLVDPVATGRLAELLLAEPARMTPVLRGWAVAPDLWRRRSAIIAQVKLKGRTDLALLHDCIRPNMSERDFFIRKAIGWALRAHAWTDPGWVHVYVSRHQGLLSPLSRREALKNIG